MTLGIIRLIAERDYGHHDPRNTIHDLRVFDVLAEESDLADRIESDMKRHGWEVHREEL